MSPVITLPEEYAGKFVARVRDRVIAVGNTMEEVLEKVKEKGYDPRFVIVDYVPDEDIVFIL